MSIQKTGWFIFLLLIANQSMAQAETFSFTGAMETYTVPEGITLIEIEMWGAQGGSSVGMDGLPAIGGLGGYSKGKLAVTPGQVLHVYVGGAGAPYGAGGFNGGGQAASEFGAAGGGGSDVRVAPYGLSDRVIVAGGGGGGSFGIFGRLGGDGGGLVGGVGAAGAGYSAGTGGTQVAGGEPGCCHGMVSAGSFGQGGGTGYYRNAGGGGGWYGGGSGSGSSGGCGGSSYIDGVLDGTTSSGERTGNGLIIITPACDPLTVSASEYEPCEEEEVTLEGTSDNGGTVSWDGGATNGVPFIPGGTGAITYTATSDNDEDCWASVDIEVHELPSVEAGVDESEICNGDAVVFSESGDADTYEWDPSEVASGDPYTPEVGTATYTLTGTITATGCENTDEVTVTVHDLPVIGAGDDQEICAGDEVVLTGSGAGSGGTYSWDGGVTNGIAFEPLATSDYIVTGTDANECENTDTVNVIVNALPAIDAGLNDTVCIGGTVVLSATGLASPDGYEWTDGVVNAVSFVPDVTHTYYVTGTDENDCVNTDSVLVVVHALPDILAGDDQAICIGDEVTLSGSGAGPGGTYVWDGGITDGVAFEPITTATYIVTGTDANGCENTDETEVEVYELPEIEGGDDLEICIGDEVTLAGSGAGLDGTYDWDGGVTDGVAFEPGLTNDYIVLGTDANGCENSDTLTVVVNMLPIIDAGENDTICAGSDVVLSATGLADPDGYAWSGEVENEVEFVPAETDVYYVIGTDENGCVNTDSVLVLVHALPIIYGGEDQAVCIGGEVVLNGTGAEPDGTYAWDGGITDGVAFTPDLTIDYIVTGTDINGCENTDTVNVEVYALPPVDAGEDFAVCIGDEVTLSATGAGADGTYDWDEGVLNDMAFTPSETQRYYVLGTDANGCENRDSILVTINPLPVIIAGDDIEICAEEEILLTGEGAGEGGAYVWNNGVVDGQPFVPSSSGDYILTGTDANGCQNSDTLMITLKTLPVVNGGDDQRVCIESEILLEIVDKDENHSYEWDYGVEDGIAFTGYTEGETVYTVTVVDAEGGCENTDEVRVEVVNCDTVLIFPTGFSPNNDGINDFLVFKGVNNDYQVYLAVYNDWGMKLFESYDYQNDWDGTNLLGTALEKNKPLPAGTYYYVMKYGEKNVVKNYIYIEQ